MADNVTTLPDRGATLLTGAGRTLSSSGTSTAVEGTQKIFKDIDPASGSAGGARTLRSGQSVQCILVRNVSGVALLPKRVVKYKAGYRGRQVDGYCALTAEEVAGIVDEFLPAAGAPNNDLFWIVVKGPTLVKTPLGADATNVFSAGDIVYALTAVTSQSTTSGRVQPWVGTFSATETTDGSAMKIAVNRIGRVMSAKTTANTNADMLIDAEIQKSAA